MLQPTQPQLPTQFQAPSAPTETDSTVSQEASTGMVAEGATDDSGIVDGLKAHLDQLPDNDKAFLAEHLTNEFVRAIGLINGPEVAGYLAQFVDPNKVMVPVPRDVAEQHLAQSKGQAPAQPQTQGPSQPTSAPSAPSGGVMAPRV